MKIPQLVHPRYWPFWFGLGILRLITMLPYRVQLRIGRGIGRLIYLFPSKFKKISETNIKLCFPNLSCEEQKNILKKNFESLGIGIMETGMAWWLSDEKLRATCTVHGLEHVEAAFAKGKGIILLGPHFTCLEMIGRLISLQYSFAVMYQPHKKPFVQFIHERFRKKKSIQYIPRHRMREVLRTLQNNVAIWYAYDVDGGKKRSVFAPFFGIPTASLTAVSRLVKLSDATVVPISFYRRDHEMGYDIFLGEALQHFPSENLQEDATRLNWSLEQAIRNKPEQYVWQYKRFKTRPDGEPRFY